MDSLSIFIIVCMSYSEALPQEGLRTFTFEDLVVMKPEFMPDRLSVTWINDDEYIYIDEKTPAFKRHNVSAGTFTTLINANDLLEKLISFTLTTFSEDQQYILMYTKRQKVFRRSFLAEYYVYNIATKAITKINNGILQVVVWGKGHSLAYVKENNVYYLPDVSNPTQVVTLTNEGVPGQVYFGVADWVYQEELLYSTEGLWFSPQGTFLAVLYLNDICVDSVVYPYYGNLSQSNNQYPKIVNFKYPKSGRTNPFVGLRVFMVNKPGWNPLNIAAPLDIVGVDHILGRVNWLSDRQLLVLWLNRRQNISVLTLCDLLVGQCSTIRVQAEPKGWIGMGRALDVFLDSSTNQMVELIPQIYKNKRYFHATLFDFTTGVTADLTPVDATVTKVLGWNAKQRTLFYLISPKDNPWKREVWVNMNGYHHCISCKDPLCHYSSGKFSTELGYGVIGCSASYSPPRTFLYNCKNGQMTMLQDNEKLAKKLKKYYIPERLFKKIYLEEGVEAHISLILPPNMSKDKKYPLIVRVYGGPSTTMVNDAYQPAFYYNLYLATNKSYVVAAIDVRGTGAMDVDSMFAVNNALGTVEVADTLKAVKMILKMYSFIDPERVGAWGWSYGGFLSSMMLIRDDEKMFACVASVAPVTNWLNYDSVYTERYMSTPQDNPVGYQRSDLLQYVEKIRGRKYLLIHGTGDDNVHYQNSLLWAKALQKADIEFQQVSYTDEDHTLSKVYPHLYHTLDRFWEKCFDRK